MIFDRIRRAMLFLVAMVLPQEYLGLSIAGLGGALTPNKLSNLALLAVAGISWATRGSTLPRTSKNLWMIFFQVSIGVSFMASAVQGTPMRDLLGVTFTLTLLVFFYVVVASMVQSRRDLDLIFKGFALGVVIVALSALLGFGQVSTTGFGTRTGGVGGNPNGLAHNLFWGLAMTVALFMSTRKLLARAWYAGAVAMALAGMVLTQSRSGFLAVATIGVMWMARYRQVQYILPLFLVAAVFLVAAPEAFFERVGTISADPQDQSAAGRIEAIPQIFHAFASSPLVGLGHLRFVPFTFEQDYTIHKVIHNAFLGVLAEQGLLGFIPFVALWVMSWRELARSWRTSRRLRRYGDPELAALGLRASMLQIGLSAAAVFAMFQPSQFHKVIWLSFALSTATWHLTRTCAFEVLKKAEASAHAETEALDVQPPGRGLAPDPARA